MQSLPSPPPATDPLAGLRDIHLPDPVPFWPPAPGWWIACGLLLAIMVVVGLLLWRRARSLRQAALRRCAELQGAFEVSGDAQALALGLSTLLRQVAIARHPREEVAGLYGDAWFQLLARTGGKHGFPDDVGRSLADAVYSPAHARPADDVCRRWVSVTRNWIGAKR